MHHPHIAPLAAALAAARGHTVRAVLGVVGEREVGGTELFAAGSPVLLAARSAQVPAGNRAPNSLHDQALLGIWPLP